MVLQDMDLKTPEDREQGQGIRVRGLWKLGLGNQGIRELGDQSWGQGQGFRIKRQGQGIMVKVRLTELGWIRSLWLGLGNQGQCQ